MRTFSIELISLIAIAYVSILFIIAYRGDQKSSSEFYERNKSLIYSLALAVYCSSWTFFGAVGSATRSGWDFLAIYLGPILVFIFGYRVIQRIIIISKQYSITSISDFLSSRYGKSRHIAVLVTFIAVVGSLPYISLQLHAISMGFTTLTTAQNSVEVFQKSSESFWRDIAFYSAIILALFSILFGTRHLSVTEHHRGMMNAIAFESIVKLVAILFVGLYATQLLFSNFNLEQILHQPFKLTSPSSSHSQFSLIDFTTKLFLSMGAIMLLPRQFQVAVVEADDHRQMKSARWLFPLYLLLISLVVVPIALAGLMLLPGSDNADFFVLLIPQRNDQFSLAIIAFVGGISAATGMVIVASISLSTMVCNDVVMPLLIRSKNINVQNNPDLSQLILRIRRITILVILLLSYGYYKLSGSNQQLANIGLLSFAATIQLAPAMIAALYWQKANQRGVMLGLFAGFLAWFYCLLMPNFIAHETLDTLYVNFSWLHPHHLFGIEFLSPLTHGVVVSLALNSFLLILGSLRHTPNVLDKIQASIFTHTYVKDKILTPATNLTGNATIANARLLCENIIGASSTQRLFSDRQGILNHPLNDSDMVDKVLIEKIERAIAGVVGASTARHIITTQLLGDDVSAEDLFVMMDETTQALQFNQDILQASFENISQGISVIDKDLNLIAWNTRYKDMFQYPEELLKIGTPIDQLIRYNLEQNFIGEGEIKTQINKRLVHLRKGTIYTSQRERDGIHIKINGNPIPGGGFVTSFTDISQSVESAEFLKRTNEVLEERVIERTKDLERLNQQLQTEYTNTLQLSEKLKSVTKSKTRFLAAASHDLLQPINAARLFTNSMIDYPNRLGKNDDSLLAKIDSSLVNADKLLRALLDISKLDTGTLSPEISNFAIQDLMHDIETELSPIADKKGISIKFIPCSKFVTSDKTLLRSIIQNLVSNAIRYTQEGRILVGCRSAGTDLIVQIYDTGTGISEENLELIFNEFHRIQNPADNENQGLGLGLAITRRLAEILGHTIQVNSKLNSGSMFSVTVSRYFGEVVNLSTNKIWTAAANLNNLKVLYLENSLDSLEAMTILLTNWGCEVISCQNYDQAMKVHDEHEGNIDVFLADYRLETTNTGLDFLNTISANEGEQTCILITAEQDPLIKKATLDNGHFYLSKPVEPAALRSILTRLANLQSYDKELSSRKIS